MTTSTKWQLIALTVGAALVMACLICYWATDNAWFLLAAALGALPGLGMVTMMVEWLFDLRQASRVLRRDRLAEDFDDPVPSRPSEPSVSAFNRPKS